MTIDVESASCRAGKWMYLFFNRNNSRYIEFWKVDDEKREPKAFKIKVDGNEDISAIGESIAAVYIARNNEIHIYFAAEKNVDGENKVVLKELALKNANSDADPGNWTEKDQHLNSKEEEIDRMSILSAIVDERDYPRVFYQEPKKLKKVSYAAYENINNKSGQADGAKKDWTFTTFTGLGV